MSRPTERRQRFEHLLGIDRYRIVLRWADGSFETESYDETTIDRAKSSASTLLAPATYTAVGPVVVEIWFGHFQAIGGNDCQWEDVRLTAVAPAATPLVWDDKHTPAVDPMFGEQLELI